MLRSRAILPVTFPRAALRNLRSAKALADRGTSQTDRRPSVQQRSANVATTASAEGFLSTALAPVAALLFSVSLLLMGNGLQGTLLPVRGNIEAFSAIELGLL